ncbi:MAG: hypothetical protein RIR01_2075 [Bacteroidota bacterium]|jgi:hypothetical protein
MRERIWKKRLFKVKKYKKREFYFRRVEVEHDFLKYIRVVRYWTRVRHKMTLAEFELLCFLYSEAIFDLATYQKLRRLGGFTSAWLEKMISRGYINIFRENKRGYPALYELSAKSKNIMRSVYRKLLLQEPINEFVSEVEMIKKQNSRYSERQYTRAIQRLNYEVKEQRRRPSQELFDKLSRLS